MTLNDMRILKNFIDRAHALKTKAQLTESQKEKQELKELAEFYFDLSEKLLQHIRTI